MRPSPSKTDASSSRCDRASDAGGPGRGTATAASDLMVADQGVVPGQALPPIRAQVLNLLLVKHRFVRQHVGGGTRVNHQLDAGESGELATPKQRVKAAKE